MMNINFVVLTHSFKKAEIITYGPTTPTHPGYLEEEEKYIHLGVKTRPF